MALEKTLRAKSVWGEAETMSIVFQEPAITRSKLSQGCALVARESGFRSVNWGRDGAEDWVWTKVVDDLANCVSVYRLDCCFVVVGSVGGGGAGRDGKRRSGGGSG